MDADSEAEMDPLLAPLEQEYLLRAIEAARDVRDVRRFYLWTQGQFQALLPHRILVCVHIGAADEVLRIEALHSAVLDSAALQRLTDARHGLALRLARQGGADGGAQGAPMLAPASFQAELRREGLGQVMVHGTERLPGGSSWFVLFGMPQGPGPRHAYFFDLLLPYLHLALLRLGAGAKSEAGRLAGGRALSARELEVLHWVGEGKSNDEVGQILGISGWTVKNHLQRIYQTLGVSNRTQAVSRRITARAA